MLDSRPTGRFPWTVACICLTVMLGCSRGEGESCQTNNDCAEGLTCDINNAERGTCKLPGDIVMPPEDGGTDSGEPVIPEDDAGMDNDAG